MPEPLPAELARIYEKRFDATQDYRRRVWSILVPQFFQRFVPPSAAILDLGCGYGEFINSIRAGIRYAMDLNPRAREHLAAEVRFFEHDCSTPWPLDDGQLDAVFSSNFFEHLPDKEALGRTLEEAFRCLKPQGCLIALGPNIKFVEGRYWDFWDHHVPLTEASLSECLVTRGFNIELCHDRFLPYTMVGAPRYPAWTVAAYIRLPLLWRWCGGQFLIVARKPNRA